MMSQSPVTLNDCGCCQGTSAETPVTLDNRPGLSAIAYRVGIHGTFKRTMLARLSSSAYPALRMLTTREDDDFTIALLDAWAVVGDVLSFYQERIANESYWRTATERLSLLEMARLIGYELRPGVAATTLLAFSMDETPGAPESVIVTAGVKAQSVPGQDEFPQTFETIEEIEARPEWNALKLKLTEGQSVGQSSQKIYLEGTGSNLRAGDALIFVGTNRKDDPESNNWDFRYVSDVTADPVSNQTLVILSTALDSSVASGHPLEVHALRQRAALFGYNAPDPRVLPAETLTKYASSLNAGKTRWLYPISGSTVYLDNNYPAVEKSSWVVLTRPGSTRLYETAGVSEAAVANFAMTGKAAKVQLDPSTGLGNFSSTNYRGTTVYAQSERLAVASERPIGKKATGRVDNLLMAAKVDNLLPERRLVLVGIPKDAEELTSEDLVLDSAKLEGNATRLTFTTTLQQSYQLETVMIYANVARATHGETTQEVLGAGDATRPYQKFGLKQSPVTYVRDTVSASGAVSTLAVRVNDILWHEVPSLYQKGRDERVFVTRRDDEGKMTVQFGDGQNGARLPTGIDNVRATYRKGLGAAGNLESERLTTLLTRPLGLKEVANPVRAAGGADGETRDEARRNAPVTVRTLDRIVSLQDYEDFAQAYAGIAKARATWTWSGQQRGVFVTVAGANGDIVETGSDTTGSSLLSAMQGAGNPFVPLSLASYVPVKFTLDAVITVELDYDSDLVLAAVENDLRDHYSFEAGELGKHVFLSEIMAVIQSVDGVVAVDVNYFHRLDPGVGPTFSQRLIAAAPSPGVAAGEVFGAELLMITDEPLGLETAL
ncbi:MAG: putative baseplate assembly protein [Chloroflexota bacterium]|nr:putative baseplate assembly protein [Chloroflexota bacterium]